MSRLVCGRNEILLGMSIAISTHRILRFSMRQAVRVRSIAGSALMERLI